MLQIGSGGHRSSWIITHYLGVSCFYCTAFQFACIGWMVRQGMKAKREYEKALRERADHREMRVSKSVPPTSSSSHVTGSGALTGVTVA